ncbi:MAG: rod shape-determining protein MreD [Pseudomonadota bacterium]
MVDQPAQAYWLIPLSLIFALVLALVPFPGWAVWARPEFVALALIYWSLALPHRVGIITALCIGLALDVLEGAVLGQNALALIVVTLLCLILYQRVRVFSLAQQSGIVFILVGINQLLCQWVQNLQGAGAQSLQFLLPAASSAIIWPLVLHYLRALRRHYRVS